MGGCRGGTRLFCSLARTQIRKAATVTTPIAALPWPVDGPSIISGSRIEPFAAGPLIEVSADLRYARTVTASFCHLRRQRSERLTAAVWGRAHTLPAHRGRVFNDATRWAAAALARRLHFRLIAVHCFPVPYSHWAIPAVLPIAVSIACDRLGHL